MIRIMFLDDDKSNNWNSVFLRSNLKVLAPGNLTCSFVYNYLNICFLLSMMRFEKSRSGLWDEGVNCLCLNRHLFHKSMHGFKKLSEVRRVIEPSRIKKNYKRNSFFINGIFLYNPLEDTQFSLIGALMSQFII